jgi:hypothetical protein
MAKEYFQDILPPEDDPKRSGDTAHESDAGNPVPMNRNASSERSIRNISMPERRMRLPDRDAPGVMVSAPPRRGSRWWLWIIALAAVIVLGILALVALRSTTVTVVPRSQAVTFTDASVFTAYPAATAAQDTLTYSMHTQDYEQSLVVKSTGTVQASDKASGLITVYNDYQSSPFRLVKNTRFESSDGHIFRTPEDIVIPGKSGSTPGQVSVTVVADQPGEAYNVSPSRFTVPGLQGAASYAHIYAQSSAPMSGGFVGERPDVSADTLSATIAALREKLQTQARADTAALGEQGIVLPDLAVITYEDAPLAPEGTGSVRVVEKAHVAVPTFAPDVFAKAIAAASGIVGADVSLIPSSTMAARFTSASTTPGTDPFQFALSGSATIVWDVDTEALKQALVGKPQSAFQSIATNFAGIQEAHARLEPFWKSVFPTDPSQIKVTIEQP